MQDLGLTQADIYVLCAKMVYYPGQSHERQVRAFLPLHTPSGGLRAGGGQEGDGVEKQDYGSNFSADAPHPHPNPPLEGEGAPFMRLPWGRARTSSSVVWRGEAVLRRFLAGFYRCEKRGSLQCFRQRKSDVFFDALQYAHLGIFVIA